MLFQQFIAGLRLPKIYPGLISSLNQKGQSLIEYLILVALVGVGSLAIVRVVASNVSVKYAQVAEALGSKKNTNATVKEISDTMVSKRDLTDFLQGAKDRENK